MRYNHKDVDDTRTNTCINTPANTQVDNLINAFMNTPVNIFVNDPVNTCGIALRYTLQQTLSYILATRTAKGNEASGVSPNGQDEHGIERFRIEQACFAQRLRTWLIGWGV